MDYKSFTEKQPLAKHRETLPSGELVGALIYVRPDTEARMNNSFSRVHGEKRSTVAPPHLMKINCPTQRGGEG